MMGIFLFDGSSQDPCDAEKVRRNLLVNFSISFWTPTLNTCETAKIIIIMTKIVLVMYGMVNGYARQVPSAEEPLGSGHMTSKYNPRLHNPHVPLWADIQLGWQRTGF